MALKPKDKVATEQVSSNKLHRSECGSERQKRKRNIASERTKCQKVVCVQSRHSEPTVEGVGKVLQVHKYEAKWQS